MRIIDPEITAVSDTTATVAFATVDDDGELRPAPAEVVLRRADGGPRRVVRLEVDDDVVAADGVRLVTLDTLEPATLYDVDIVVDGESAEVDQLFFPGELRTLPTPPGELLATVATVSDLHFGEEVCGIGPSGDEGPVFRASDEDPPYWRYVNEAVAAAIAADGVDAVVAKGDLTGDGHEHELRAFGDTFSRCGAPLHVIPGNHDCMQPDVNPMAVLGQPDLPAWTAEVPGCRLVLVDTVERGVSAGVLPPERRDALAAELDAAAGAPVLCFAHHYTSGPPKRLRRRRSFGIDRADSEALLALLADYPNVGGFFAGHTHRNRVRRFAPTGRMPHAEVCATKDYPGAWAHYRIHEGGYLQEIRRPTDPKAVRWAHRTKEMFWGLYRVYAIGTMPDRCFTHTFA